MKGTQKGIRLHIGIFGRRNVGKSSLLNAITRQEVSIVSEIAGTTTDPVEKPMELLPIGPVLFIDTAGVDDIGALGEKRITRTRKILDLTDLALLVVEPNQWNEYEQKLIGEFQSRGTPFIVVFNKVDIRRPDPALLENLSERNIPVVQIAAKYLTGISDLREALIRNVPEEFLEAPPLISDLIRPGELVVLVVPVDMEAPKGRLILPQVQTLREILDSDACAMVVKESELARALVNLNRPPALVVTDSQAFKKVTADTPPDVPLTSFSILFARNKGDLFEYARGAQTIDSLKNGERVLIAEACTHHPVEDDIGRVKIPRWIKHLTGCEIIFEHVQGHDFPDDLSPYSLVICCGSCMINRREVLTRIANCRHQNVPVTNYGVAISYCLGCFDRVLAPLKNADRKIFPPGVHHRPAAHHGGTGRGAHHRAKHRGRSRLRQEPLRLGRSNHTGRDS